MTTAGDGPEGDADRAPGHEPVLVDEIVQILQPERGGLFIDCTLGLGGHTRALIERGATRVLGIDRDRSALERAPAALGAIAGRVDTVHADYRDLAEVLDLRGVAAVDGILADLGVSSMQLDAPGRGFSFRRDEPLDMRMDPSAGPTAADLVNETGEQALADAIFQYGEERYSRRIAKAIVAARPLRSTGELAAVVRKAVRPKGYQRLDPATRTFQALRIWVNHELEGLDTFLGVAARRLATGGRLAVVTFHSLEDRIVKHTLRELAADDAGLRVLTKKPIRPGGEEVARNPRARSAKLRGLARTGE